MTQTLQNRKLYDQQARVIIETQRERSELLQKLTELRQIEFANTHWLVRKELLIEARKPKELYREKYHAAKHGYTFDDSIPKKQSILQQEHVEVYRRFLTQTKRLADEVYTFRDPQHGQVCWLFLRKNGGQVDIAIYNEQTNKDVTGWRFTEEAWVKYKANYPLVQVK